MNFLAKDKPAETFLAESFFYQRSCCKKLQLKCFVDGRTVVAGRRTQKKRCLPDFCQTSDGYPADLCGHPANVQRTSAENPLDFPWTSVGRELNMSNGRPAHVRWTSIGRRRISDGRQMDVCRTSGQGISISDRPIQRRPGAHEFFKWLACDLVFMA